MPIPLNDNGAVIPPIEDAKQGIQSFAMYYYQSLLDAGYSSVSAKQQVADLLEQQYVFFCEQGNVSPKSLGTAHTRLAKIIVSVENLAKQDPSLRTLYGDLLSLQSQMKR